MFASGPARNLHGSFITAVGMAQLDTPEKMLYDNYVRKITIHPVRQRMRAKAGQK
jgi:hypothetical protein